MKKNQPALLFACLAGAALVAACGQKGPLFVPGTSSTISTPVPGQQPAPVEETAEDGKQPSNDPD